MDEIRVGPTFEQCKECGAVDDGYGNMVHFDYCPKAPKGKAAKAIPTQIRPEDLPPGLRDDG